MKIEHVNLTVLMLRVYFVMVVVAAGYFLIKWMVDIWS